MACEECEAVRQAAQAQVDKLSERVRYLEKMLMECRCKTAGSMETARLGMCAECGQPRDLAGRCGCQ